MLNLNREFLIGEFKRAFKVESREGTPLERLFKLMFKSRMIDGLLTANREGTPILAKDEKEVEINRLNRFFGVNKLLKTAIQKHRLNKLAIFGPSCLIDGLNKAQYFGIGCNWAKTAVALKVGLLCLGSTTKEAAEAEMLEITGRRLTPVKSYIDGGKLITETAEGEEVELEPAVHHYYSNTACRYCLNLCAKGSDLTYVPLKGEKEALFIVRSERGWRTLAQVQQKFPGELLFKPENGELDRISALLKEKMLHNVAEIIERVELGLPVPKWSDNKLRKFYRAWNSVENREEEVF
ncbi:Coenzyme F420 hydrogenase/dehydrogenase, beta subunit C-terminal domain [Thermovibrio ammonificans]|uniref:Coenzyme F420 hydrogenase/dehydrogenase beta subunit domain protein n=1 Tax=Thermovibrio ammonificans (strain DSM 15698 / JCM 12110 / HB-1) TaxID=648996 RepID=E8T2J0_THEA1|nr:Coenzyme F420 hydrogenase/dehydrogenase, beta subunit C-terminal domain [Thermovibrio ammonificans]ADU97085.1 coenzyme F420 hydrogenase/dehydrogenase beta subunit domain protein [Thermovibrio ammonificans HB-1]